jgi:uncharacterized protein involved in outer membrane biogenesis
MIIRRLIRWTLYLFIVAVVLVVAVILLLNTIVKQMLESRIRTGTGLDPKVGNVDIGLLSPTITIENLKLYNTADFGGGVFLDMPELHVEYDLAAMRSGRLHFKLVRLNLTELSLVQDKNGRMNVQGLQKKGREKSSQPKSSGSRLQFTGIDTLNLTLGKIHESNLATGRADEIDFNMKGQIAHNVKTEQDIPGLGFLLAARGNTLSATNNLDLGALLQGLLTQ